MGCSSRLAKAISLVASIIYLLFILLQIPLFRLPCRCGICSSPIQLTCSQLVAYNILPPYAANFLLYPGDALFKYGPSKCDMNGAGNTDIQQLEIMVGSYLCVCGALLGLPKRGRMSLFGLLLLLWGLAKQVLHASPKDVQIYPLPVLFALAMASLCVRRDVKRILRSTKRHYTKSRATKMQ